VEQDLQGILARALAVPVSALAAGRLGPVTVAVIDSGIDATHPDLAGRVAESLAVTADPDGHTTITPTDPAANNDTYGHATAVASIIGRIAPNTRFIDIRVLGSNNHGSADALLAGIDHANYGPAGLMNISVAVGEAYVPRLMPLTDMAYRRGKIIVAATRNAPLEDEGYPASIVPCIGVGNARQGPEDQWRYQRDVIEFLAHGVDVPIAVAGGGYSTQTGTSFATPIVTGIVALMLGAHPGLTPFEVKALLKAFAAEIRMR
jgi:subtilisin family serine protease